MVSISVAVATYNGGKFLQPLLDSLAAQTTAPLEVVISDDASSDDTAEIVHRFIEQTPLNVRFSQNPEQLGYAGNFLKACSLCRGDVIAFCDQDDIWASGKLAALGEAFGRDRVLLCVHRATLIDRNGIEIGTFDQGITETKILGPLENAPLHVYFGFSMSFRRSVLDLLPDTDRPADPMHPPARFGHDTWVYSLVNFVGATMLLTDRLVGYRQHGSNVFGAPQSGSNYRISSIFISKEVRHAFAVCQKQKNSMNLNYIHTLRGIVDKIPDNSFEFSRSNSTFLLSRHVTSLVLIGNIYRARGGGAALMRYLRAVWCGGYRDPIKRSTNVRRMFVDLLYVLTTMAFGR